MIVAYVRWKDALHDMAECDRHKLGSLATLHEVGFLVKETAESVTLALEAEGGNPATRLWLTIPRVNIIEMRTAELDKAFPKGRKR